MSGPEGPEPPGLEPGSVPERRPNSGWFRRGFDERRGHGPAPGTGGRPTSEFMLRMVGLADRPIPEEILQPSDPEVSTLLQRRYPWVWTTLMRLRLEAWQAVADRARGRPGLAVATDDDRPAREALKGMSDAELLQAFVKICNELEQADPSGGTGDPAADRGVDASAGGDDE